MTPAETLSNWKSGEPCEKHEMAFCVSCKEQAGIRQTHKGEFQFSNDCTIETVSELTGATYTEAAELLTEAGGNAGRRGNRTEVVIAALEAAGATTTTFHGTKDDAKAASENGRQFYVISRNRTKAHASTIIDGTENRPFRAARYEYFIFEVA